MAYKLATAFKDSTGNWKINERHRSVDRAKFIAQRDSTPKKKLAILKLAENGEIEGVHPLSEPAVVTGIAVEVTDLTKKPTEFSSPLEGPGAPPGPARFVAAADALDSLAKSLRELAAKEVAIAKQMDTVLSQARADVAERFRKVK